MAFKKWLVSLSKKRFSLLFMRPSWQIRTQKKGDFRLPFFYFSSAKSYFKLMVAPNVWITPNWPANLIAYSNPKADFFLPTKASAENPAVKPVNAFERFSVLVQLGKKADA